MRKRSIIFKTQRGGDSFLFSSPPLHRIIARVILPSRVLTHAAKLSLCLSFLLCPGCTSFLANRALKNYPVQLTPTEIASATNNYQHDFLYVTKLAAEAFPLQDQYFPPDRRTETERAILAALGAPRPTSDTYDIFRHLPPHLPRRI